MSINETLGMSLTTEIAKALPLREELADKIYQVFHYVIIPCTSFVGIVGNVTSIVLLTRKGFKKCSSILLLALAVSDILFLIGINNVPKYLYVLYIPQGFRFTTAVNYVCYISHMAFSWARTIGLHCAMVIPVIITVERILAIRFPLTFHFILTPRRAVIIISCLFLLNGAYCIYSYVVCMKFKQVVVQGITIGFILRTDAYFHDLTSGLYETIDSIVNYTTGIIPISIVTVGSVVIGVQIAILTQRRQKMTANQVKKSADKQQPISKTTKTLLNICILYSVCSGFAFAIAYITQDSQLGQDIQLNKVLVSFHNLLTCVNCVGDFVIYVGANSVYKKSWGKCTTRKQT
ncbi:unnamed protein product [Candidula unifasciata]|uniref:G-protein coupled receptors family 1 profile domain-containing protein n=1 Tax=Candidula unifasciata TaxID=100452 RepID=A0A8S3Z175_9EUPU|nr:unnamed protein product [Candidula unifasciata]